MKKFDEKNVAENPLYHDTWKLLKKYRDVDVYKRQSSSRTTSANAAPTIPVRIRDFKYIKPFRRTRCRIQRPFTRRDPQIPPKRRCRLAYSLSASSSAAGV